MLRIKELRCEHGLSQRALAKKIGANQKTVNLWEREKSSPSADFVVALADTFECSADYLLGREDDIGRVNVIKDITAEEQTVLEKYNKLSPKDRETVCSLMDFYYNRH